MMNSEGFIEFDDLKELSIEECIEYLVSPHPTHLHHPTSIW